MKKVFFVALMAAMCATTWAAPAKVSSPGNVISVDLDVDAQGIPTYQVFHKGKAVVKPSKMGFDLAKAPLPGSFDNILDKSKGAALDLRTGFEIKDVKHSSFNETWKPVWGEESEIVNNYNEMAVTLVQPKIQRTVVVKFRVYDDGVGFRYEFPQQPTLNYFVIKE